MCIIQLCIHIYTYIYIYIYIICVYMDKCKKYPGLLFHAQQTKAQLRTQLDSIRDDRGFTN